jgi:hypothetical protein
MNKLLVTVFLLCTWFTTNAIAEPYLSDSAKQKYLAWIKEIRQTTHSARFALAVAPNGAWGSHWGYTIAQAKTKALKQCKKYAKSSPCEVVDVDGKSDFINQKTGEPLSYCYNKATNYWYFNNSLSTCGSDVKVTKQEYTNKRLKRSGFSKTEGSYELLASGSFVAQCEKNNKLEVRYSGSNCSLDWDKGGESTRCKIKNSIMKFSSYDSAGQATLNFQSSVLKGRGGVYKCILAGDIKVVEEEDTSSTSGASSSSSSSTSISTSGSTSTSSTTSGSDDDPAVELEYWNLVRDSNDVDLLQDYLDEYPNGKFAPLARLKIKKLLSSE